VVAVFALCSLVAAKTITFKPTESQYYYSFGCQRPVMNVNPGDRLILWTEDALNGQVKTYEDIFSKVTAGRLSVQKSPSTLKRVLSM